MLEQLNQPKLRKKLTKKQIAQACGVSRITLDRVLKGQPGVGREKREQILHYLQEHGYRKNKLAQSLVKGKSKSLGIIVFDLENAFYAQLVNAFARAAQAENYETYIMLSDKDSKQEKLLMEALLARQVDGIALNSAVADPDYGLYLKNQSCPVLSIMNQIDPELAFLGFDEYAGMRELVSHAVSKGYRRFFYVCPPMVRAKVSNMDSLLKRQAGFEDEVTQHQGLRSYQFLDQHYLDQLLMVDFRNDDKACIICTSDIYAVQIQAALRNLDLYPPIDYGIAGYDNIPILRNLEPRLTTISLQIDQLGRTAAQLLLDAANGIELPVRTFLPYQLMKQKSL